MKFVEVGILPLVLFGTAAYPLLKPAASTDTSAANPPRRNLREFETDIDAWCSLDQVVG